MVSIIPVAFLSSFGHSIIVSVIPLRFQLVIPSQPHPSNHSITVSHYVIISIITLYFLLQCQLFYYHYSLNHFIIVPVIHSFNHHLTIAAIQSFCYSFSYFITFTVSVILLQSQSFTHLSHCSFIHFVIVFSHSITIYVIISLILLQSQSFSHPIIVSIILLQFQLFHCNFSHQLTLSHFVSLQFLVIPSEYEARGDQHMGVVGTCGLIWCDMIVRLIGVQANHGAGRWHVGID